MTDIVYSHTHPRKLSRIIPDLVRSRELLVDLTLKDLKVRYRYALMGVLWAVLEPLIMMLVLTFVFSVVFTARLEAHGIEGGRDYAVFILCGLIPWQFFATALRSTTHSLVDNRNLIKKVYFPREILPLSSIGVALVNFVIGGVLLLIVAALLIGKLPGPGMIYVPVIFLVQLALVIGLGLLTSTANATYRDVAYMVDAALLFGFYATPVLYPPDLVESTFPGLYPLYMLNPMAGIITAYRDALLHNTFAAELLLWPAVAALVALPAGAVVFRKRAATLADSL